MTTDSRRIVYVGAALPEGLSESFEGVGVTVERVETVRECLAVLPRADCVVCERTVPDGDVVTLCERLRRRSEVPVVAYVAGGSEVLAGELAAAGADGYVPADQGVATLVSRVVDLLVEASPDDRFGRVLEATPLAAVVWSPAFEVVGWNDAATALFGYPAEEAVGREASTLLLPEEGDRTAVELWGELTDPTESSRLIDRNRRADGSTVTCEWFNTPVVESGEVVNVVSFVRDVTADGKRADALETLQSTTAELLRADSKAVVAESTVAAAGAVIDGARAGLRLRGDEPGSLEVAAMTDELAEHVDDPPSIGPGDGVIWDVYATGEPAVIEDASTDEVPYELPISVGDAVVHPLGEHGTLTVASSGGERLGSAERHLLAVLAATAEAALDRAERERELAWAKTVVETVGDSVYALDTEGRFVTINETLTAVTGYDREELLGAHASTVLTAESIERGREAIERLRDAEEGAIATYDVVVETKGGDRVTCEVTTTLLVEDGAFAGTVGIVRDVSERARMERELVERKEKIETLHGVVSRLEACETESEVFSLTVDAAEGVLNFDVCSVDAVRGDRLVKRAVSEDVADGEYAAEASVEEGIAGKTHREGRTFRIDDLSEEPDAIAGGGRFRSVLSAPIGDRAVFQATSTEPGAFDRADQELTELLLSHVADALERTAFEDRLREERDRFLALFENVPDAVVYSSMVDGEPIVEAVNPAFERVFGFDAERVVGEPIDEFIVPGSREEQATAYNERGERGRVVEEEVKRRTDDGLRDFMLRIVPITVDERSDRVFAVYTDVTERKQRRQRVEILNRVLRHDLRNGMNIIEGCAVMLAEAVDAEDERYARTIQEQAGDLISLADKTRAVERSLESADTSVEEVDVVGDIERAIERVGSEFPETEVAFSLPESVGVRASELVGRAIYHVLENAVVHNDQSVPRVEVTVSVVDDGETVRIAVADNGPGIPEEERELLAGEEEITQLRHASGLGLWFVNWAVRQSGGRVEFAENTPRGTVVTLELPAAAGRRTPGLPVDD